jgi:hypothetical protein
MGHDEHFLRRLDRVADDHVELALTLYRDQELLKEVLGRAALPEGTERLAISLDDPKLGPFVIVTRAGRFVTCLGKGMRIDADKSLPLLTKERLDAAVSKVERMRERIAQAIGSAEQGGLTTTGRVFARMKHHGLAVSREDVELLLQVRPLIASALTNVLWAKALEMHQLLPLVGAMRLDRLRPPERDRVEAYGRASWIYAHMMVLACPDDMALQASIVTPHAPEVPWWMLAMMAAELGTVAHMTRALWMLGKNGKRVLPDVKGNRDRDEPRVQVVMLRELALGVIGCASSKLRAEATKALRSKGPVPPSDPYMAQLELTATHLAKVVRGVLDDPEDIERVALGAGKLLTTALIDGVTDPNVPPSEEQAAAVPDHVARALWPNLGVSMLDGDQFGEVEVACQLPSLARMLPQDLYLPEHYVSRLPPMDTGAVAHFVQRQAHYSMLQKPPTVLRAAPKVGRNDPCPCGSGKKAKRCCATQG